VLIPSGLDYSNRCRTTEVERGSSHLTCHFHPTTPPTFFPELRPSHFDENSIERTPEMFAVNCNITVGLLPTALLSYPRMGIGQLLHHE
jgi:hypothetical protein